MLTERWGGDGGHRGLFPESPTDFPGEEALSLSLFPVGVAFLFSRTSLLVSRPCFSLLAKDVSKQFPKYLQDEPVLLVVLHIVCMNHCPSSSSPAPPPLPLPPSYPPPSSSDSAKTVETVSDYVALASLKLTVVLLPLWFGCILFSSQTQWRRKWGVLPIISTTPILDNRLNFIHAEHVH